MKKAKTIGKKTLSVFLAVLMVLTAWVWVAPTEASATNGSYYVKITWKCVNKRTYDNNYTGYSNRGNGQCGLSLFYKSNNGRGTESEVYWNIGKGTSGSTGVSNTGWMNTTGTYYATATVSGFPTRLFIFSDNNYVLDESELQVEKIEVGSSSSATLTTLWAGTAYLASSTEQYYIEIKDGVGTGNHSDYAKVSTTTSNWVYPYVKSATSISSATAVADIGIPPLGDKKDTSISTRSIQYYALDNYGVRYEPTSYTVTGVSGLTTGTGWSCGSAYKIEAKDGTTKSTVGVSQTATVTMNWNNGTSTTGQKANTTATFYVYNPRYKVTYNGNGGTLGTGYTYGYYGRPINHSTSTATTNNVAGLDAELFPTTGIREGYTFDGIYTTATGGSKISATQTVSADVEYFAHWNINQYTATFYGTRANDAGTDTVEYIIDTSTVDYNTNPVPPATVDGYSLGDYDYTFKSWDKEISAIGVSGAEYRATYTSTFVPANYDAVDEIVAEANDIINSENYEGIYSEESRSALENAVASVVYNQGRTSQNIVDSYVPLIRAAIDGLGRQKYSVLFIDAIDNSVIELRYPVYYGDAITMPEAPVRGFTSTDHYVFREWTTSETTDNINFVEKNMIIIANYDKVAHTYTDTELPSNCTTQSGVLHKCSCGYEYVEYAGSVGTEHNLETEWTIDIAPTCTTVGSKSRHCTRCSYRAEVTEIPALEHDFSYQGVVITPGCENDGAEVSECQRCGYDKYELLPSVGHNWTEEVVAPTCTSSGYTVKTCSNCYDEDIVSFVDPIAHTYTEATDEYVAPTCTGLGKKVSYCSCGAQKVETISSTGHVWNTELTTDYESTCTTKGQQSIHCSVCDVINQESITEIPENGHTWGNEVCEQKESCGIRGLYVKTCEVCQVNSSRWVDALTHNYVETVVSATCTQAGESYETCDNCGDIINYVVIQPLGHNWNAGVTTDATCTSGAYTTYTCQRENCGETKIVVPNGAQANLHDFTGTETIIDAATCEADGKKTVQCKNCTETTTVVIPKLGHNYGAWQVVKEATNTEDGQWKRVCANNAEHIEYITIPKGGHTWDNGTVTKTANCTTTGTMVYKCNNPAHTDCGITLEVTVPVTQHTIAQKVTDATCTSTGTVEAYCSTCDVNCEKPFSTKELPVVPHTLDEGTAVAPTCTTSGYTLYECEVDGCSFSYKEYDASKPATGHTYTSAVTKDASCTEEGVKTFTCSCGASYTETIPATGHTYVKGTVTAANCTTAGTEVYTCSCGDTYTKFIEAAKGHTYENWEVITPATADKYGVQKGTCTCGDVKYDILAPIGNHIFTEEVTKAATCTTAGEKTYTCSVHTNCSANYTEEIPATGHTQKITYTAPTCIDSGITKVVCSVESCKAEIMSETVPATGIHNFDVTGVKVDATCTATGTMTYTCATDGCTAKKIETIPAKGHDLKTTVTDAKCGEKGSVVTTCSRCTYSDTTELAAKGHIWKDTPESTVDATCETDGSETYKCQNCDAENVVVIPKLGHDWSEWTVTPSTNNDKGSVSRTCKREGCTVTETVDIPAGGHELVVDTDKSTAANCTTEGKTVYKCKNHADCGITVTVTVPEKGHTNVVETTQATCTVDGSIVEKCGVCGVVHKTTTIPAKGHTTTVTTTLATCTQEGSVVEYCENCKTTLKTTTIEKLQHDYSGTETVTKEATCTEDGSKTVQCKTCEDTTTVVVPHTGHTWGEWNVTTPATNATAGEMTRTCSNGTCTETVVIPAGGHTWDNGTVKEEATCTTTGTMVYTCTAHTDCGITLEVTVPVTQHTVAIDNKAASCTEKGHSKTYCSVCKKEFNSVEIPVKAHNFVAQDAVAPTCTTSGYTPYTCTCGASYNKYDETKPATGHDLVEGASTATCVGAGEMTLNCNNSNCNYSTTVDVPALGHNYVEDTTAEKTATCAAAATKTYKCSRCESNYTVSVGEKSAEHTWGAWQVKESATATSLGYEIRTCNVCGKMEVRTIAATGEHNFNEEISRTPATCETDGSVTYKCSTHNDCGLTSTVTLPALGHTKTIEYKAASCTETGYTKIVCSVEGCDYEANKTEIPALGHLYVEGTVTNATCKDTGKIEYTCTRTGCTATHETVIATNSNAHQYVTVVTDSTCTVKGSVVTKCALCGNVTTNKELPVIEHSWNSGEVKEGDAATCTTAGTKTFTCTVCSATKTETIAKLGHDWGKWTVTKASTNTEKGTLTRTCSRGCTETAEIPEGGHAWDDGTVEKAASCTETGTKVYKCENHTDCGITFTETLDKLQHELETTKKDATCEGKGEVVTKCKNCDTATITTEIPATGHTYNDGVKTDATCTSEGKIVYTCTADKCSKTKEVTLDKLQHVYAEEKTVAATCTASGYIQYKCNTCDSRYVEITTPANGHTYTEKLSSTATCTGAGTLTLKCKDCTATMTTDVPALGHDYVQSGTTDASCAAGGTETYKCSACDDTYTEVVSSKLTDYDAHDWNAWVTVKEASYTSIGYKTRTCKICDKLEVETIAATGDHDLQEVKRDEPTCTEKGTIYYECKSHTNCGVTDEVEIPATGHTEELSYKAATCTEAGYTKIVCSVEGCDYVADDTTIPALDHVWGNEVIAQPTCSSTGSIVFTCTSCNTATKTVTIPENENAHQLTKDVKLATCKEAGYVKVICENTDCKYVVETELPMLHHDWSDWKKTDSTNDNPGSWISECSICKEERTLEIPEGGHNLVQASYDASTCTTPGTVVYKCTNHANCSITITETLALAQHKYVTQTEAASCSKEGSVTVICTVCSDKLVDNMATAKLPHNYEEIKTTATCTQAGYTTFKCKTCGHSYDRFDSNPLQHTYETKVTAPTCTTAGYTTYTCSVCKQGYTSNFVNAKGHSYTGVETAPTCTEAGYTTYTCACGESYIGNPVSANGHNWGDWEVASGADGDIIRRICKTNADHTEEYNIPAGGHEFDTSSPTDTTTGNCKNEGTKTFKCTKHTDCGVEITVKTELGAHDWTQWTKLDATNTEDGSWSRECKLCNTKESHVIPAGNHSFKETPDSVEAATCSKTGTATYKCTNHANCGVVITVKLDKVQHTPKTKKVDSTCTVAGYVKTYCEKCDEVISNVALELAPHIGVTTETVESTCITQGAEVVKCSCGETVSEKKLPLKAHDYDVTYENGVYTYTCKQEGCGHTYTETVDISFTVRFFAADKKTVIKTEKVTLNGNATAPEAPAKAADENYHYTFSEWDRDFSNITADLDVYPLYEKEAHYGGEATCKDKPVCDKCNTAYGETDASKHVMATKVTPATCENDGSLLHYCSVNGCDYSYSEVVNKLGHNFGAWETYQNGNCTTPYITIRKCQNYGCEEYEKQERYGSHTWYTQPEIAPTCTTEGYSAYKYCVTCGVEIESVVIPKLDHKDANGDGMCDYCTHTEAAPSCSCMCHSTGFMKFIYSIVRFFWMITKSTPTCSCGAHHY